MGGWLLIGGAGFIGSHLARELLDRGEAVAVLDAGLAYGPATADERARTREWRARTLLAGADVVAGDARDTDALRRLLRARRPDAVVHLANLPLAAEARRRPVEAARGIVDATRSVLTAAAGLAGLSRLTYISSSMVYGDFAREPMPERGPLRPHDPYGRLKLRAERLARSWAAEGRPLTVVRPSAVYGLGDVHGRFVQRLVDAAAGGPPLVVDAPLESRLDFTWVGDVAWGIAEATARRAGSGRTFNITRGDGRTLAEAIAAARAWGADLPVVRVPPPAGTRPPRRGALDIDRARRTLGYRPRWSLEDGLAAYLGSARASAPAA